MLFLWLLLLVGAIVAVAFWASLTFTVIRFILDDRDSPR